VSESDAQESNGKPRNAWTDKKWLSIELQTSREGSVTQIDQSTLPGFDEVSVRHPRVSAKLGQAEFSRAPLAGKLRIVRHKVSDLHPWPGFEEARRPLAPEKLRAMTEAGEAVFDEPILVTPSGTILDGHARWVLARQQGIEKMDCIEHTFSTEEEALRFFLQRHTARSDALMPFSRVALALELKPVLREQARENQQTRNGGPLPSKLTQGRPINVRQEISSLAQVSAGNVTKVVQILNSACPELLAGLYQGEASIHRAHQWSKLNPRQQQDALFEWICRNDIRTTIRRIIAGHRKNGVASLTPTEVIRHLARATHSDIEHIEVHVFKHDGMHLAVSEGLLKSLGIKPPGMATPS
jgi:hypothetical protein